MRRLSAHLGGPRLWVKREDATGLGFGGNKLRKLHYVLHEAITSGGAVRVSAYAGDLRKLPELWQGGYPRRTERLGAREIDPCAPDAVRYEVLHC